MDANADADARGSTIALHERCSGELKMLTDGRMDHRHSFHNNTNLHPSILVHIVMKRVPVAWTKDEK